MTAHDTVEAVRVASDIAVDEFDNPAWRMCQPVQIATYWSGAPAPSSRQAEARLLWSKAALHARFVYPQHEPLVASATPQIKAKTLGLWDRDVCEIFIAPDPAAHNLYFEFEAAPTGEWVDLAIEKTTEGRKTDFGFDSGMKTAARIAADQITISLRIPWSARIPCPRSSERWRVNLFRCVGSDPNRGYVTWRPTYTPEPSFHAPEAFGWLLFTA